MSEVRLVHDQNREEHGISYVTTLRDHAEITQRRYKQNCRHQRQEP